MRKTFLFLQLSFLLQRSASSKSNDENGVEESTTFKGPATFASTEFITTENPFRGSGNESKFSWVNEAIRDIAYYLRAHKFNEFDRRYERRLNDGANATGDYFGAFPRPPLRSLHWEVHKNCYQSFLICVEYLGKKVKQAGLQRTDDTVTIMREQKWNQDNHSAQIASVDSDCNNMRKLDLTLANPFQGPIERFQWRVTASYYMCWYTMHKIDDLRQFSENCDNFASCLDPEFGANNKDPRANDSIPFACARYSFCPDPCCPVRHLSTPGQCWDSRDNPCSSENLPGHRKCKFRLRNNTNFGDMVLNRWNVSCGCSQKGFQWNSRYGICVDIDECTDGRQHCDGLLGEACVNLPGSFRCACQWGYSWSSLQAQCVPSPALALIKLDRIKEEDKERAGRSKSIVKRLYVALFHSSVSSRGDGGHCRGSVSFVITLVVAFRFVLSASTIGIGSER